MVAGADADSGALTFKGIEQISSSRRGGSFEGNVGVPRLGVADLADVGDVGGDRYRPSEDTSDKVANVGVP